MMGAIPCPLDERPEAFDRVDMNALVKRVHIAALVIDNHVRHHPARVMIGAVVVRDKRGLGDLYGLLNEAQQGSALGIVGHFGP